MFLLSTRTMTPTYTVPGGPFRMGCDDGLHPEDGEGPAREVTLAPYSLGTTSVTQREFQEFVDATGYRTLAEKQGAAGDGMKL